MQQSEVSESWGSEREIRKGERWRERLSGVWLGPLYIEPSYVTRSELS